MCAAQVLVQIGAFFWPALLPGMMRLWSLNNSEAGWITAIFYAAYMVSVPVLVTLTDRLDAKHVYLFGVGATVLGHLLFALARRWLLVGDGDASADGHGLGRHLHDGPEAPRRPGRRQTDVARDRGPRGQHRPLRRALVRLRRPAGEPRRLEDGLLRREPLGSHSLDHGGAAGTAAARRKPAPPADGQGLFNFLPVFRNTSAMAYALAYCIHTLEMSALRGWGVAFLAWVAASTGTGAGLLSPTAVVTALGIIGTVASVAGNEAAIRLGRRRLIMTAMAASILIAASIGWVGTLSYWGAVALLLVYGLVVWLDSSSLTAGAAGTADPARRGATLAVHSMLGYAGGFVGPLIVGWVLDGAGGMSRAGWSAAFLSVAALMALALAAFAIIRPRELAGDKGAAGPDKLRTAA